MSSTVLTGETLNALRMIVWGNNPREDVFQRWAQGCKKILIKYKEYLKESNIPFYRHYFQSI